MVRNYVRKSKQGSYGAEALKNALKAIKSGSSIREASRDYDIPRRTLQRHLKGQVKTLGLLGRFRRVFDDTFENAIVSHILQMQRMFYGLTPVDIRKLAYSLAEENSLDHPFNKVTKRAGEDWLKGFMHRHPDLSIRKPEATSVSRAVAFNRPSVNIFFNNLKVEMEQHAFPPDSVWNMDESGITNVHRPRNILAKKGQKQVGKITSGERGRTVTVVCCMNASGTYIPPMLIFPRKRMPTALMNGAPPGAIGKASDNGWINHDLFLCWLQHFVQYAKPSAERKCLLVLDGHSSHKSLEAINYARDHGIVIIVLPPHTTHKLQPLDRTFFGPLKTSYNKEVDKWMVINPGCRVSFFDMAKLFGDAYKTTATMLKASNGFSCTGIWPFNPDVFSDGDFEASAVTDEPEPDPQLVQVTLPLLTPAPGQSTATDVLQHENPEITPQMSNSVNSREDMPPEKPSQHVAVTDSELNAGPDVRKQIEALSPVPQKQKPRTRKRKPDSSAVVTSSPFKRLMEDKEKKSTSQKRKKPTDKASTQLEGNDQSEVWHCLYCNDKYEHPPTEDWLQCIQCNQWFHADCGDEMDVCDLCR